MRGTVGTALSVAFVFCLGGLFSSQEMTLAQQGADNKAVCDIEEICLSSIVCDQDIGELDADGDLIALKDATGTTVKKAARKKVARKKATRKKAATKKTARKSATYQFNERRGDEIRDMLTDEELAALLADLVAVGGFFGGVSLEPVCGDGVVESPEVCESTPTDTCGSGGVCSSDCSTCLTVPQ